MNYEDLKNGKYLLTLNINNEQKIIDCLTGETLYSHGKNYILTVNNGIYSIWDDFHDEEQISYNFPALEWFNASKLNKKLPSILMGMLYYLEIISNYKI